MVVGLVVNFLKVHLLQVLSQNSLSRVTWSVRTELFLFPLRRIERLAGTKCLKAEISLGHTGWLLVRLPLGASGWALNPPAAVVGAAKKKIRALVEQVYATPSKWTFKFCISRET